MFNLCTNYLFMFAISTLSDLSSNILSIHLIARLSCSSIWTQYFRSLSPIAIIWLTTSWQAICMYLRFSVSALRSITTPVDLRRHPITLASFDSDSIGLLCHFLRPPLILSIRYVTVCKIYLNQIRLLLCIVVL